ncbi:MAG: hypothetical protein ABIA78_02780 [archaeon]
MDANDLLSWSGNVINFGVLLFIIRKTFGTSYFDEISLIISAGALLVSVLINLYTAINKIRKIN